MSRALDHDNAQGNVYKGRESSQTAVICFELNP